MGGRGASINHEILALTDRPVGLLAALSEAGRGTACLAAYLSLTG